MTEGWKCPNCGKAHAPWMATCDQEHVTWTSHNLEICDHHWVSDTGGHRCLKCGKSGHTPQWEITCSSENRQ